MPKNRRDFVRPGTVAGQVVEVASLVDYCDHTEVVGEYYDDAGNWKFIEATVPGVDTEISLSGQPFVYRVRAVNGENGPQVLELHIDSPGHDVPITADDLRKLARYQDRLAYVAANPADMIALLDSERFQRPEQPPPKRPGRKGHPDGFYAEIAAHAKRAHQDREKTGLSARAAIAARYQVTPDTADKWLARAREAGHLKAGELGGKPKPRNGGPRCRGDGSGTPAPLEQPGREGAR